MGLVQGSKRHRIPDPQHCGGYLMRWSKSRRSCVLFGEIQREDGTLHRLFPKKEKKVPGNNFVIVS